LVIRLIKPTMKITQFTQIDPVPDPVSPVENLKIEFKYFKCIEESSDGPGSDETFLVVLKGTIDISGYYKYKAYTTSIFEDVDSEEIRSQNILIYNNTKNTSEHYSWKAEPHNYIFLIGMAECDDCISHLRSWNGYHIHNYGTFYATEAGADTRGRGLQQYSYPTRDIALKAAFINLIKVFNIYDAVESLGVHELKFTEQEIDYARRNPGKPVPKTLTFTGDDSHYEAIFHLTGITEDTE
jgi:hypothetical protein